MRKEATQYIPHNKFPLALSYLTMAESYFVSLVKKKIDRFIVNNYESVQTVRKQAKWTIHCIAE